METFGRQDKLLIAKVQTFTVLVNVQSDVVERITK